MNKILAYFFGIGIFICANCLMAMMVMNYEDEHWFDFSVHLFMLMLLFRIIGNNGKLE